MTRLADGPFDHATKVAYTPTTKRSARGGRSPCSGRKLDQGVLASLPSRTRGVAAVHRVALTESVPAKECCREQAARRAAGGMLAEKPGKIASRIDIPEFAHSSVTGEWLIPCDGVLVVSLGVQTTADQAGKAVIAEHLVLIEAKPAADEAVKQASLSRPFPTNVPDLGRTGEPTGQAAAGGGMPGLPMPMPAMPSRSLPQALAADGSPMRASPAARRPRDPLGTSRLLRALCQPAGAESSQARIDDARHRIHQGRLRPGPDEANRGSLSASHSDSPSQRQRGNRDPRAVARVHDGR